MSYIKINENEMSKMINATDFNKSINFKFGTGGVAIDSYDTYAVELLEEIRDMSELNEYHESFNLQT